MSLSSQGWKLVSGSIILFYLSLVRLLRYRRRDRIQKLFPDRASCQRMTLEDAFRIQKTLAELEFPSMFSSSVFFALIKTYGIPSISKLLVATGQLADEATTSKRAVDTGVILTEFILNKPSSARNVDGIARMNFLHDRYRKAGKILDDDMLYTLSLFALEPLRWTNQYERRQVTNVERCATGTYWKDTGETMNIPYDALPSSKSGWQDGLHWLEELKEWSVTYEKDNMVPAENNRQLATQTLNIALFNLPNRLKPFGRKLVAALLEPRLRTAMMLEDPAPIHVRLLQTTFNLRKLFLRYLALPRPHCVRIRWFSDNPDPQTGCFHALKYVSHPWYVKPTFWARWGPIAWVAWMLGNPLPGDHGEEYVPSGYRILELGPKGLEESGLAEMNGTREDLMQRDPRRCPFGLR